MIETHPHLSPDELRRLYGWAEMDPPDPVTAGQTGTWRIIYHAGRYGVDDGGVIKIAWRDVSDWGTPQFDDPAAAEFASVATTGPATLIPRMERQRYIRPWRRCITIDVVDDSLKAGDTITLTLGDTAGGSPGSRAQTYGQEAFEFRVAVDWCGTWVYTEVPSPVFPVISGPPARLVVVSPTSAVPGQPTWMGVRVEDLWGNPCRQYDGEIHLHGGALQGLPAQYRFTPADSGVHRFEGVSAPSTGTYRVTAADPANGLAATSNPLRASTSGSLQSYWGDLHGQSEETVGTNPVSSYFRFARDTALVDFIGHQGNDFQVTADVWQRIRHQVRSLNEPGRFVTFLGYEWSGNTPVGGDHNVYYLDDDGPLHRSSHVLIEDKSDIDTDCLHIRDLYAALRGRQAMLVPHVGGRYADLNWHDSRLEPVLEVYSEWGEFEWFLHWALELGWQVGFVAGSDDHKGRPGAAWPGSGTFGVYGGLTCVQAPALTRQDLWQAIEARRCYGTSGARILVEATADGHPIGSAFTAGAAPTIDIQVAGTADIERIDLFRGNRIVDTWPDPLPRRPDRVRIAWAGQRIRARKRLVRWDGRLGTDRGRFVDVEGYAFDTPAESLRLVEDRLITWESVTTGDADGIVFGLEGLEDGEEATLTFQTGIVENTFTLRQLRQQPIIVNAGGVDMRVVFEMAPAGSGFDAAAQLLDRQDVPAGTHAYWLRVTQTDGHKAWISPFFVTLNGEDQGQ